MKLSIKHITRYHYARPPLRIDMQLRLWPSRFDGQGAHNWQVQVNDVPAVAGFGTAFGDAQAHVHIDQPVMTAEITASGRVDSANRSGVVANLVQDIGMPVLPQIFLRSTRLTDTSAAIADMALSMQGASDLDKLHTLMGHVRDNIVYRSGATTVTTTAAEAFAQGAGVCQDHAHLFIAAARVLNIPARYVVGYYLAGADEAAVTETHGWAEAWVDGLGWVGFDATNGVCPGEHHVRLCCGFDAQDAAPVKGYAFGGGEIGVDADVRIAEIAESDGHVMQQQQQ